MPNFPDARRRVIDKARQRFVATFVAQCDSIRTLVDQVAAGPPGPMAALTQVTHRLSGYAGTIGFPTVSTRAAELERLLEMADPDAFDAVRARDVVDAMREAFTRDLASPPVWTRRATSAGQGARILVAEDEFDQRAIVTASLEDAGYVAITVASGDLVVDVARAEKPALILLDIAMPRLDGYSVCRLLKADPELAGIPVIFMTARANLDDKLAGLMLGADEFLSKPVDMRELILRIQLLLDRARLRHSPTARDPCAPNDLSYDAFLTVANDEIGRSPVALAIVRFPAARHDEISLLLAAELRARDVIGAYGPTRVLILMPEMTAVAARDRLDPLVDRLVAQGAGISVGLAAAAALGTRSVEALIGEADQAIAEAQYLGQKIAIWAERPDRTVAAGSAARTVVVAEDDPDVARIVDAQLRAGGYKAIIAFDGEQALAAVRAHVPDVLVLDLMMPKLSGFDVLTQVREGLEPRPKIIVLSGRGREQDVVRAFELGADDYMTKPFNPHELMARIARLLK